MPSFQVWTILLAGAFLPAYLLGSIPFGFLFARSKGIDIRKCGSGNIGATNVWRVMGKAWGIPTFILDFLKVPAAAVLAKATLEYLELSVEPSHVSLLSLLIFLGAVVGHNFPIWLGFKGGKGIATSAGGLVWLLPLAFPVVLLVWVVVFFVFRYVSVASMVSALSLPIGVWFLYSGNSLYTGFTLLLALMAIWRHRSNLQKLMAGTEHRWTPGKKQEASR
jgi:acyl phosphate:glycerol-3-phosphate acyltransferase